MKGIAIGAAIVAAISVFFPWLSSSSSASAMGHSASYSTSVLGIFTGAGFIGLVLAIVGIVMASKRMKWTFVTGAVNLLSGLAYMFKWFSASFGVGYSVNYADASVSSSVNPAVGVYLFVLTSLLFVIITYDYYKEANEQETQVETE